MTTELPQTPPRTGRRRGRLIALVVVLLLVAGAVSVALLWPAARRPVAAPPPPPSPSASPTPSPSPSTVLPYPYFAAGSCFDHPQLSPGITKAQGRPCDQPHDGEAIANPRLPDGLTKDSEISMALLRLCQPFVGDWTARQGGGTWYSFPIGPYLAYYLQGMREVTCGLTSTNIRGGGKLTGHLKGWPLP